VDLHLTPGPLALFAIVASITPGPNNLLLMRSGAAFGVRRSLRHILGIQIGFALLVLLSFLGVSALLLALPGVMQLLRIACFLYLLWLAWLIFQDARPRTGDESAASASSSRPLNTFEGVSFQLINPKAWMMSVTVASAFYGGAPPTPLDLVAATLICMVVGGPSMLIWTAWGASINTVLKQVRARQIFNYSMSIVVVLTAVWMLR
jgi:threonine/homoserine/homoserine lactone efflux protein